MALKETDDIYAKNIQITEKVRNLMYILKANFMINSYPHNMEITTF